MRLRSTPILQILLLLISLSVLVFPSTARAQGDPLIDTRSVTTGQNFNAQTFQNLPVGRNPAELLSQAPGVQTGEPLRPSGMTGSENLYTIDGIAIGDPAVLGGTGSYSEFDLIQEIQVQTGGASAEYGQSAGGVVNVVTKEGSKEWRGTGRFLVGDGDANGVGALTNPGFQIDVVQDAAGGYCLQGFQVTDGGTPVATAAGSRSLVQIGLDVPFTMGMGAGAGNTFGAGRRGDLNLSQIPGCAGQPNGMTFVDTPGFVTPPTPTHMFFGENGVYAVDMGRIGSQYGVANGRGLDSWKLEDTHIFNSNFYLTGMYKYANGGFQLSEASLSPQAPAAGGIGGKQGFFVYGVDGADPAGRWTPKAEMTWDRYAIQIGDAPTSLPDGDDDGQPDSYFISFGSLKSVCPNVLGGAFTAGSGTTEGGTLQTDSSAGDPDCEYLQDRTRIGDYFSLNLGLRADAYEPAANEEYKSPFAEMEANGSKPRLGGGTTWNPGEAELGGPIIKDRLWLWGSYGIPDLKAAEAEEGLFSESYYGRAPNYAQLFPYGFYTLDDIQSAPEGRGVQGVGLEIDGKPWTLERASAPLEDAWVPGGSLRSLADRLDSPLIYVVANGGPTGEVFQVRVVQPAGGPIEIDGFVAVEPVAATAEDRAGFERELADMAGSKAVKTVAGYCLDQDLLAPLAGTVYRVAPAAKQAAFEPMRRALDAAREIRDAGQLHPDSDPTDYYHSIRQWAVWTIEKGYDREGFLDAFVERTEKNFHDAGQPWSADVAAAVRSYGEGRWTDIAAILDEAEGAP